MPEDDGRGDDGQAGRTRRASRHGCSEIDGTRRRLREVEADQSALRHRQQEFERHAVTAPSTNWPEVAEKARYLIQLFAATPEARDPRRQALIASVLEDLARLSG